MVGSIIRILDPTCHFIYVPSVNLEEDNLKFV